MGFWTDTKFNSLTVLIAAVAPLAVGAPVAMKAFAPETQYKGCPFPVLKGKFRSALSDVYPFEYDITSNKLTSSYPNQTGYWIAKGNDIACKDGSVFLMRDGEFTVDGVLYQRTCFHYGIIREKAVSGHYACQQIYPDKQRNQDFSWTADFVPK